MLRTLYEQIQEYGVCVGKTKQAEQYIVDDTEVIITFKEYRITSIKYYPIKGVEQPGDS